MTFKVFLNPDFYDPHRAIITLEVNGVTVYPLGLNNKGFLRISAPNEESAIAIAAAMYKIDKRLLISDKIKKFDQEKLRLSPAWSRKSL